MSEGHFCMKCIKFVLTKVGIFDHPHAGIQNCLTCYNCGHMVYLKKQDEVKC